jgi:hypothetical protein
VFGVRGHVRAFESGPAVAGPPHSKIAPDQKTPHLNALKLSVKR